MAKCAHPSCTRETNAPLDAFCPPHYEHQSSASILAVWEPFAVDHESATHPQLITYRLAVPGGHLYRRGHAIDMTFVPSRTK